MSAFSNRALSQRGYAALIVLIALACAIAVAITMLARSHSTSQPSARSLAPGSSALVAHHPARHHPVSNAGHGLNS